MKRKVRHSNLITLPKAFVEYLKINKGDIVDVVLSGKKMEVVPLPKPASIDSGNTNTTKVSANER